ncbi:MAG: endo alpha-1,4 polygalactosaminidase [Acidimicrobiales bacterium]
MPTLTRRFLFSSLSACITVGLATPAFAASTSIALSQESGRPGDSITVVGKGFPIKTKGSVSIGTTTIGSMKTGSKGGFQTTVKIPPDSAGSVKIISKVAGKQATRWFKVITTTTTTVPSPSTNWWKPTPGLTWQWQLSGLPIDTTVVADIYNVDLFEVGPATVSTLHNQGRKVICYMSAGSYEDWRSDAADFPAGVLGKSNGWPGERWLDIRALDVLMPIMEARFDLCKSKGFDGVEVDNVDGYTNRTGFLLTNTDQLTYNRRLAKAAHDRGLAIALKNDLEQIPELVGDFDLAINEECAAYNECDALKPFIAANKAVLHAEYDVDTAKFCPISAALKLSSIRKNLDLDAWRQTCP